MSTAEKFKTQFDKAQSFTARARLFCQMEEEAELVIEKFVTVNAIFFDDSKLTLHFYTDEINATVDG